MNELEGNANDESGRPGKEVEEGSVECAEGSSEGGGGAEEEKKKCDKTICENEIPKRKTVKKNVEKSCEALETLKKTKSVTSNVLVENRKIIFSPNWDFAANSFICYICLVHEPVNSLVHHLQVTNHKAKEILIDATKNNLRVTICKGCDILIIGFPCMICQHFTTNFHKNLSEKNGRLGAESYFVKKDYELIVKGLQWVPPYIREDIFFDVFEEFGEIKKMNMSEFKCVIYFKNSCSVKENLGSQIIVDGCRLKLQWREIETPTFLCGTSVIAELTNIDKLCKKLDELIEEHHKIVHANEKEREARVCESILNAVGKHFPGTVCHVFGSRLTGLSFEGSDLDVYLDCGRFYYGDLTGQEQMLRGTLETVAKCLKVSPEFTQNIVIRQARVPLVKVKHVETGIVCDISFKNGLAVENSALIKFIVGIDQRTKPMLLFVKYWMKKNNFYGRPYFSSYVITLLVLYYLAQYPNPVLPTIDDLRSKRNGPEKFIAGWNCGFLTNRNAIPKTKNADSIPQLLFGFFSFYEKFDFSKNALSPLTGNRIVREDFRNFKRTGLPHPYKNLASVETFCSLWNENDKICVMDPFDLSHNLTQNFPKMSLKRFYYSCGLTAHLLSETMLHRNYDFLN